MLINCKIQQEVNKHLDNSIVKQNILCGLLLQTVFEKKQGVEKRRTYYQNVNNCLKKRKSKYGYKKGTKRKKQNNKTSTSATFLVKKV